MQPSLTLYELNCLVRQTIEGGLPDQYWIQAELSDVHINSNSGHCYVEFVQKDQGGNALLAKARGIIWANVFCLLRPYFENATGQAFAAGIKVLVEVSVSFHELYGYSLTVHDIDPTYTLGDMARRRREILQQLEAEGVLLLSLRSNQIRRISAWREEGAVFDSVMEGNNLEQVTAVYFNGKEVSAETFAASAKTYIETAIPDDTPIGYEAGEWRDTLIVRSPINEFGMPLTIISKEFNIIAVAKFNNDGITVGNAVTQAQLRDKIQLQGTGLNYVTEVYVNGLQLSDFEKSEATINLTIPEKTPIGERAGTDANIIRLVNEFGEELEYGFTIIGQQPVLTHVADADGTVITSALCGETVQAVGKYLESVSGITCNGVSVTTYEVDAEGTNITFTIPENLPTGESYAENNLVE